MSKFNFLLSYSVKPNHESTYGKDKGDKVRKKIEDISKKGWNKLENVETTFKGFFEAEAFSDEMKKKKAMEFVNSTFVEVLEHFNAKEHEVEIECSMMISTVTECFEFTIVHK